MSYYSTRWDDLDQLIGICFNEDMDELYPARTYRESAKKALLEFLGTQPHEQIERAGVQLRELLAGPYSEDELESTVDVMGNAWDFSPYRQWLQGISIDIEHFLNPPASGHAVSSNANGDFSSTLGTIIAAIIIGGMVLSYANHSGASAPSQNPAPPAQSEQSSLPDPPQSPTAAAATGERVNEEPTATSANDQQSQSAPDSQSTPTEAPQAIANTSDAQTAPAETAAPSSYQTSEPLTARAQLTPPTRNDRPSNQNLNGRTGIVVWRGSLNGATTVTLSLNHANMGSVIGGLPGTDCTIEVVEPQGLAIEMLPAAGHTCRTVMFSVNGTGLTQVVLRWTQH